MPDKLHELQRLWLIEATRYNVLPLDDRVAERINPDLAGRPVLIKGKTQILFGGMGRLSENSVVNVKNKSHSVTAEIEVPASGAEGVIIAQGGNIGGWSLYAKGGKLKYCYNLLGIQYFYVESASTLPAGEHQVRMEFAYAGGGLGKGGTVTLFVDGKKVGEGKVAATARDGLLRRRRLRRRLGHRLAGLAGLRPARQRVHRPRQGRADRDRRRRREARPPGLAGGRACASRWRGSSRPPGVVRRAGAPGHFPSTKEEPWKSTCAHEQPGLDSTSLSP